MDLQPVCSGQETLALQGSTSQQPGRAPAVCWHPPPSPERRPYTPGFQHSGSEDRGVRAAPDAGMQQDMAGTLHQGHATGHSPALHRPLRGRLREHTTDPATQGNRAGGSCGIHPDWPLPMLAFSPAAQRLWFCSGTSQPSTYSSPVTIAVSTGSASLLFLPLLSTLNYHNTVLCQWACPESVSHAASPREATSPQLSPQTSPAATSAIG